MDEGTARAIRDALTKEVQEEAAQAPGRRHKGTLNDTQLQVRAERSQALVDRVNLYTAILNEGLEGLKNVAQAGQRGGGGRGHARLRRRPGWECSVGSGNPFRAVV